MTGFVAEVSDAQVPTVCHSFGDSDGDDFIAEIRPIRSSVNAKKDENEPLVTFHHKRNFHSSNLDLGVHCTGYDMDTSDAAVLDMLSSRRLSTEKLAGVLRDAVITLTRKLFTGKAVARIEGNICVSLDDPQQAPIYVDLSSDELCESDSCYNFGKSSSFPQAESQTNDKFEGHYVDFHRASNFPSPDFRRGNDAHSLVDEITMVKTKNFNTEERTLTNTYDNNETSLASLAVHHRKLTEDAFSSRRSSDTDSVYRTSGVMEPDNIHKRESVFASMTSPFPASPIEPRSCSSVDSLESLSMLRATSDVQRFGFEKTLLPRSHGDEIDVDDDDSPVLVIDESFNAEDGNQCNDETGGTHGQCDTARKEELEASSSTQLYQEVSGGKIPANVYSASATPKPVSNGCIGAGPSLMGHLSGDSEKPHEAHLVLCRFDVQSHSLSCRLCHATLHDTCELSRHALNTHGLFACTSCYTCFPSRHVLDTHTDTCGTGTVNTVPDARLSESASPYQPNLVVKIEYSSPPIAPSTISPASVPVSPTCTNYDNSFEDYGQLLDLSMKKKPELSNNESSNVASEVSHHVTEVLSAGKKASRDGCGQPGLDSIPVTVFDITRHQASGQTVQGFSGKPVFLPSPEPRPRSTVEPSTNPSPLALHSLPSNPPLSHFQPRVARRFSPYSREKIAELAAKFLASRSAQITIPVKSNVEKKVLNDFNSSSVSPSATEPTATGARNDSENLRENSASETTLKNRVSAFVKCGGHRGLVANSESGAGKTTEEKNELKASMKENVSEISTSTSTEGGMLKCRSPDCGLEFASFAALSKHAVDTHGRYLCEFCDKSFTARPNRDRHARYHTGERPYKCDLCPLAFFRGDDLKYHRTTRHPAAEPIVCNKCSRTFTWSRDLERHLRNCRCKA